MMRKIDYALRGVIVYTTFIFISWEPVLTKIKETLHFVNGDLAKSAVYALIPTALVLSMMYVTQQAQRKQYEQTKKHFSDLIDLMIQPITGAYPRYNRDENQQLKTLQDQIKES